MDYGLMARRCKTCYLEAQPGDERCRRCGGEFQRRDYYFWLLIFAGLCGIAAITVLVRQFLNR